MYENRKRRFGDRKDGFRLRRVTPLFRLTPFIMNERSDSIVYYEFDCYITKAEQTLRELRQSRYHALSYTHLSMAAIARTIAENTRTRDQQVWMFDSMQSVSKADMERGENYLSIMERILEVLAKALDVRYGE